MSTSRWGRLALRLGVVMPADGRPLPGAPRRSRYNQGPLVSPRLDQDVDALRVQVAELQRRLDARS